MTTTCSTNSGRDIFRSQGPDHRHCTRLHLPGARRMAIVRQLQSRRMRWAGTSRTQYEHSNATLKNRQAGWSVIRGATVHGLRTRCLPPCLSERAYRPRWRGGGDPDLLQHLVSGRAQLRKYADRGRRDGQTQTPSGGPGPGDAPSHVKTKGANCTLCAENQRGEPRIISSSVLRRRM